MAWQDRAYYRDSNRNYNGWNRGMWLLTGSVSLGSWFGIDVRVHVSLLIVVALTLISPWSLGGPYSSFTFCIALFASVLLHEFGHCLGSWSVGGSPSQIMLTPLGGLALAEAPRRPWATFWTVLCGPLVNLVLCAICYGLMVLLRYPAVSSWNPLGLFPIHPGSALAYYVVWFFQINYLLLIFNVIWPVFPLDGGQLLQSLLWVKLGYYKSMNIACTIGLAGAGVMTLLGLSGGNFFLVFIGISCLLTCYSMRAQLKAAGPWGFEEEDSDYSAAAWRPKEEASGWKRARRSSARAQKQAARRDREARAEQEKIDAILAKVSAHGMHSLSWMEKRTLHKATERQRRAEPTIRAPRHH